MPDFAHEDLIHAFYGHHNPKIILLAMPQNLSHIWLTLNFKILSKSVSVIKIVIVNEKHLT